ncbi:MAG TPA: hypothetical protein VF179_30410 [Thermoanaerobaculia bacterium]|nr:hypothetical protein [Thermoanaerobaculia bacterium]
MANLRGSIGPNGYVPPANVTVTWRRPGAPDIQKPLNKAVPWTDDTTFRQRYGAGDPETIGRQITAIGSEQLGGRAWLILKELYAQAGLNRVPKEIGQEVWDFAVTECGQRPANWCDYKRFTGKPDPICGENCPKCTDTGTGGGTSSGGDVPTPTNVRLEDRTLTWDWQGEGIVTFNLYQSGGPGTPLTVLKTVKQSPIVLAVRPPEGTLLLLYATQRKKEAAEVKITVGGPAGGGGGEDPPKNPLSEILAPHTGSKIWEALSAAQREEIVARVRETLPPSAVSVPEDVKSFLRLLRGDPGPYSVGPGQANPVERLEAWALGLEKKP